MRRLRDPSGVSAGMTSPNMLGVPKLQSLVMIGKELGAPLRDKCGVLFDRASELEVEADFACFVPMTGRQAAV
jgi:hypothetical protein